MEAQAAKVRPISIAILALGGEGGGVLADWMVDLAEHNGYLAQTTSVPGVAQRTGATVYYVELFPKSAAQAAQRAPVLALMPTAGDVDVVLASELMEAARGIERGFVTPDRTLLIASTHRVFAMTEKIALADGRADSASLLAGCREAARELVAFDMAALAEATGSALSAVLFGALAGSSALPFPRGAFEAAIRRAGVGVKASLTAFAAGFEAAQSGTTALAAQTSAAPIEEAAPSVRDLSTSAQEAFTGEARDVVLAALQRLVDYQDAAYAREYLARLEPLATLDRVHGDGSGRVLAETARQLALAMSYEDTIRVAELKIRGARFSRVREEAKLEPGQILEIAEFFHPRMREIADTLPAPLGRWLLRTAWARGLVEHFTRKGKVVRTTSISGFVLLWLVARLKPLRPRSLRFIEEQAGLAAWLALVTQTAASDYALAFEVARMRGLIKGYGETNERGRAKFVTLRTLLPRLREHSDAAGLLAKLIKTAQADESGAALEKSIALLDAAEPSKDTPAAAPRVA
ncbi:MAG: indolepyruvate oxidoreductase subunit beta family protein [Xanthobacteraceae bacterium]